MNLIRIRYNKTKGQPGRGSIDHVWRVFDETGKEYICKNVIILPSSRTEIDPNGIDYNIICSGKIEINKDTSTITIV